MRISLSELFLVAPAFLIACLTTFVFCFPSLPIYRWTLEVNAVRTTRENVAMLLKGAREMDGIRLTNEEINLWLANKTPEKYIENTFFTDSPRPDLWGYPYRIQNGSESDLEELRLYSTGQDGKTFTDGNDVDDIRSWEKQPGSYYQQQQIRHDIIYAAPFVVIFTPILFSCILFLKRNSWTSKTKIAG